MLYVLYFIYWKFINYSLATDGVNISEPFEKFIL